VTPAQQAALQVERLYRESHRRADEMSMLYQIGLALSANLNLERLVETISSELKRAFDVQGSFVALYDRPTGFVEIPYWMVDGDHIPVQPLPSGYGLTQRVIATRQPLLINHDFASLSDEMGVNWPAELKGRFPKSWLSVPMVVGDQVLETIVCRIS
jgi:transcriptional regulator with GAF, ATPase, and Fis domain